MTLNEKAINRHLRTFFPTKPLINESIETETENVSAIISSPTVFEKPIFETSRQLVGLVIYIAIELLKNQLRYQSRNT